MDYNHIISIHALREEGDLESHRSEGAAVRISIHALREEGDDHIRRLNRHHAISIHALREEGDIEAYIKPLGLRLFLSTPSARRATLLTVRNSSPMRYFYPRPPRGGRPPQTRRRTPPTSDFYPRPPRGGRPRLFSQLLLHLVISIHALREEGDKTLDYALHTLDKISIHALREEGDLMLYFSLLNL